VHFILGLQGTAISDGRQISQLKCHLGMDRGDHSLRQHKGSLRNQNISWGNHFVLVLLGAHVFVLVGYSMWGAKALAHRTQLLKLHPYKLQPYNNAFLCHGKQAVNTVSRTDSHRISWSTTCVFLR